MTAVRERLLSVLTTPVTVRGPKVTTTGRLTDPDALVDRLLAALTAADAAEAMAAAMFAAQQEDDGDFYVVAWEDNYAREPWLILARAALSALTGTGTGPVGYCVCDPGEPRRDCGIPGHRVVANRLRAGSGTP